MHQHESNADDAVIMVDNDYYLYLYNIYYNKSMQATITLISVAVNCI